MQSLFRNDHAGTAYVKATFQALTDAILPSAFGEPGGIECGVDEFVIWQIDHVITIHTGLSMLQVPLSYPTALLLDSAAEALMLLTQPSNPPFIPLFPGGGAYASLNRTDRIRALVLLQKPDLELGSLPPPYTYNAGLVRTMSHVLSAIPIFGYYSEWTGYGTTRLASPDYRRLEWFPAGWSQVGYPGVSYGYRDYRGQLIKLLREGDTRE